MSPMEYSMEVVFKKEDKEKKKRRQSLSFLLFFGLRGDIMDGYYAAILYYKVKAMIWRW